MIHRMVGGRYTILEVHVGGDDVKNNYYEYATWWQAHVMPLVARVVSRAIADAGVHRH
jgi:hypothetical protein